MLTHATVGTSFWPGLFLKPLNAVKPLTSLEFQETTPKIQSCGYDSTPTEKCFHARGWRRWRSKSKRLVWRQMTILYRRLVAVCAMRKWLATRQIKTHIACNGFTWYVDHSCRFHISLLALFQVWWQNQQSCLWHPTFSWWVHHFRLCAQKWHQHFYGWPSRGRQFSSRFYPQNPIACWSHVRQFIFVLPLPKGGSWCGWFLVILDHVCSIKGRPWTDCWTLLDMRSLGWQVRLSERRKHWCSSPISVAEPPPNPVPTINVGVSENRGTCFQICAPQIYVEKYVSQIY